MTFSVSRKCLLTFAALPSILIGSLVLMSVPPFHINPWIHENLFFVQRVPNKQIRDVKKMFHSRAVYDREKRKLDKEALDIIQGRGHRTSLNITRKLKSTSSLVYNRVNKCGSSTMLQLLDNLGWHTFFWLFHEWSFRFCKWIPSCKNKPPENSVTQGKG